MVARVFVVIAALAASATVMAAEEAPRYIVRDQSAERSALPFSEAELIGNTLYVAGHIGIDSKTGRAASNPDVEAKLLMDAVSKTVESAGMSMDDLVSVTVYCTDLGLYNTFNAVYRTYFHKNYPARAFIGAAQLLRGGHYEVQGIAVKSRTAH